MNGFIKLYRSMFDWEWWDDINTFRLFVTILLLANWKEKKWHGKTIPRGSCWTSLESLSQRSGLTIQQTRTALDKLISTGEITSRVTNEGRLITVEKYSVYQDESEKATNDITSDITNEQQTSNKRVTTTEEREEIYKKGEEGRDPLDRENFVFFRDIY